MRTLIATALIAACVGTETHPGVSKCETWFYVIGYYRHCTSGPTWQEAIASPEATRQARQEIAPPARVCYRVPGSDLLGACRKTAEECADERAKIIDAVPSATVCTPAPRVWCFGEQCAPTPSGCDAQREQAGSGSPVCVERR